MTARLPEGAHHLWHPCCQMAEVEREPLPIVTRARGPWLEGADGRVWLDAISSWWVNLFGHGEPRLNTELARQASRVEHCLFADFSHEAALDLARELFAVTPSGLSRMLLGSDGASAVEMALKVAFQYCQQTGKGGRTRFASLEGAYHGETLGALSVGDLDLYSRLYRPLTFETLLCPVPADRTDEAARTALGRADEFFERWGASLVALIVEPLCQCAAGMKMYAPAFLRGLRVLCDRHGVLLIADEIATGMGRTGTLFACGAAGVVPDLMCVSKGITGGYMPLSLCLTTEEIYRAFLGTDRSTAFLHSHSYTGNALACALGARVLRLFVEDDVLAANRAKGRRLDELVARRAADCPWIGEPRRLGTILALPLAPERSGTRAFAPGRAGRAVCKEASRRGLSMRPLGDLVYFMPPYVLTDDDQSFMVNGCFDAIEAVLGCREVPVTDGRDLAELWLGR